MARPGRPHRPPFPVRQMFVLALCRICEPIAFMSIFPYVYHMVSSMDVARDDVAKYVGMVTSSFAFAEFASSLFWGRLSDRVGRKPVLLGGLFGTGLSMLLFGFASNLATALIARAIGGLLNGNISVIQTTVAELVTVEQHQPTAYAIMPFVWCLGTIVGGALGGLLADPVHNYPGSFGPNSVFAAYPYLLPNLVCAFVVVCGLVVGFLFLEETHEDKKHDRDRGLDVGRAILARVCGPAADPPLSDKHATLDELNSMLKRSSSPPTLTSPRDSLDSTTVPSLDSEKSVEPPPRVRDAFTKQVCLIVVGFGLLAFHTISMEQLLPILMSIPESTEPVQLPFQFQGGFGLPTKTVGALLAVQGVLQMVAQLVLYPRASRRLGHLRTFWLTIALYPALYVATPYLALLPRRARIPGVLVVLAWKVTAQAFSYPSLHIMLANAAPSSRVLGTLNGAAASAASMCRGLGPTVSGAIHSFGEAHGAIGLAWWACAAVATASWLPGSLMREERRRPGFCGPTAAGAGAADDDDDDDDDADGGAAA